MWNSESVTEEWARRKHYLIRSLFEDIPRLSTLFEENESTPRYLSNISSSPQECELLDRGPASPLPDLYIEFIPKRICYDESEQFYLALEKEMKRLYRKDFLNICDSRKSNNAKMSNTDFDQTCSDDNFSKLSSDIDDSSQNSESEETNEDEDEEIDLSTSQEKGDSNWHETFNDATIDIMSQTFTVASVREVTEKNNLITSGEGTQISVFSENKNYDNTYYDQPDESLDVLKHDVSIKIRRTRLMSTIVEENETYLQENIEFEQGISKEFAVSREASLENNFSFDSSISEPEIMRRRQTRNSFFSLPDLYFDRLNTTSDYQNKSLSMDVERLDDEILATGKESCLRDESPGSTEINITSTPKSPSKSFVFRINHKETRRTRFVPYSSTSGISSTVQKTNQGQQTSFLDGEVNLQNLWQNFFVGIPKIFKLCSCLNHECFE